MTTEEAEGSGPGALHELQARAFHDRLLVVAAARLERFSISPGGFVELCVQAEERLWQVLGRGHCDLFELPTEELERALQEDLLVSRSPSLVNHIEVLRRLLEQGGMSGECPPGWSANRWMRLSDIETIRDELERLADALALRPLKTTPRGGRPRTPRALTKRWEGFTALRDSIKSLLHAAYFLAKEQHALTPGEAPVLRELLAWVRQSGEIGTLLDAIPELQEGRRDLLTWQLSRRLELLAIHGYANQRFVFFAAHWATELRKGLIGMPLSETRGRRPKRSSKT